MLLRLVLSALVLMAVPVTAPQAQTAPPTALQPAVRLQPFQEQALQEILASVPPDMQEDMRVQMGPMLAEMDQAGVQAMMQGFREGMAGSEAGGGAGTPAATQVQMPASPASARQVSAAMVQLEPVLRKLWNANVQFDRVVEARERTVKSKMAGQPLEAYGPAARGKIAFRIGNAEKAGSYGTVRQSVVSLIPARDQYRFNASAAVTTFDRAAVEKAIDDAYVRYHTLVAQANSMMAGFAKQQGVTAAQRQASIDQLFQQYQRQADEISNGLAATLTRLRPSIPREMQKLLQG
ncbi:MAG: hypothetical protein M3O22_02475 [Pseudomonadota bacterium]|nr:hypothetical protein [Pseudomonadota bacterium]